MVCVTLQGLWMISDKIVNFQFLAKFDRSWLAIILRFLNYKGACYLRIKKAPNQAKHLINMVCVNLEWLWMVSDRINDFRFFVKFHKSGLAIIFSFWSTMEHVSYASKKLLKIKNTSLTWFVLLWKDYGWFLIKLSIFNFWSNFTCPDLQKLLNFWTTTVHVSYASKKLLIKQKTSWTWCV